MAVSATQQRKMALEAASGALADRKPRNLRQALATPGLKIDAVLEGSGATLLRRACEAGYAEGVKILLEAGAKPNLADADGRGPAHWAARAKSAACLRELLAAGADFAARDKEGAAPLDAAREEDPALVAAMRAPIPEPITGRAEVEERWKKVEDLMQALHDQARPLTAPEIQRFLKALPPNQLLQSEAALGTLPKWPADIRGRQFRGLKFDGFTQALKMNDLGLINAYIRAGQWVDRQDPDFRAPLDYASTSFEYSMERKDCIKLLIHGGADLAADYSHSPGVAHVGSYSYYDRIQDVFPALRRLCSDARDAAQARFEKKQGRKMEAFEALARDHCARFAIEGLIDQVAASKLRELDGSERPALPSAAGPKVRPERFHATALARAIQPEAGDAKIPDDVIRSERLNAAGRRASSIARASGLASLYDKIAASSKAVDALAAQAADMLVVFDESRHWLALPVLGAAARSAPGGALELHADLSLELPASQPSYFDGLQTHQAPPMAAELSNAATLAANMRHDALRAWEDAGRPLEFSAPIQDPPAQKAVLGAIAAVDEAPAPPGWAQVCLDRLHGFCQPAHQSSGPHGLILVEDFKRGAELAPLHEANIPSALSAWARTQRYDLEGARPDIQGLEELMKSEDAVLSKVLARAREIASERSARFRAGSPAIAALAASRNVWGRGASLDDINKAASNPEAFQTLSGQRGALGLFALRAGPALGIDELALDMTGQAKAKMRALGMSDGAWKRLGAMDEAVVLRFLAHGATASTEAPKPFARRDTGQQNAHGAHEIREIREIHHRHWAERDGAHMGRERPAPLAINPMEPRLRSLSALLNCAAEFGIDPKVVEQVLPCLAADPDASGRGEQVAAESFSKDVVRIFDARVGELAVRDKAAALAYAAECDAKSERMPYLAKAFFSEIAAHGAPRAREDLHQLMDCLDNIEFGAWADMPAKPTWKQLMEMQQAWHELVASRAGVNQGGSWECALTELQGPAGLWASALSTGAQLAAEGSRMHHCVSSYASKCASGASRIFTVQREGERLGTLELSRKISGADAPWEPVQFRGVCNAAISDRDAWDFAEAVARAHTEADRALQAEKSKALEEAAAAGKAPGTLAHAIALRRQAKGQAQPAKAAGPEGLA